MCMINKGMFREIVTSSITFANSGVVVGRNVAPAVSGLTVYGDVSASGKIYGAVTVESLTSNVSLSSFSGSLNVSKLSDSGASLNDVLKYQETTPGVSAWAPGKVMVGELTANYELKDGAIVTYSEASAKFVALNPETVAISESSYIKQMGKCAGSRNAAYSTTPQTYYPGYAAITNDNRVIAWGNLHTRIFGGTANILASENVRVPFWTYYDGYTSGANYKPYGGDFFDQSAEKYIISDLYWARNGAMALVSAAGIEGGDVWVGGTNTAGVVPSQANPKALVKTKFNNFLVANETGAAANTQTGGIYLFNPNKDICAIQKYTTGTQRDIIEDRTNSSELSADSFYYISADATIKRVSHYGELNTNYTYTTAPNALTTPSGMAMALNDNGKNLLYVCDSGTGQNKIKIFDITTGFTFLSAIGIGTPGPGDGDTASTQPGFTSLKKIAIDPSNNNILYVTDGQRIRRLFKYDGVNYKVTTISETSNTTGDVLGNMTADGNSLVKFSNPYGIKVSPDGTKLYIIDQGNKKIKVANITTNEKETFLAAVTNYVDATVQTAATFNNPYGIAKDGAGHLYIADYKNNKIRKIAYNSGTGKYGLVSTFAGTGVAGVTDGPIATARFNGPLGITYSSADNSLYVTNYIGHRISKINLATSSVTIVAGTGTAGSNNGAGSVATFNGPHHITYGSRSGNNYLWVSDYSSNKIRQIQFSGGTYTVTTICGTGTAATTLSTGIAVNQKILKPVGVHFDSGSDSVYFTHLNSIQKIRLSDGQLLNVLGNGVAGNNTGNANISKLNTPGNLFALGTNLYVCDQGNDRIRKISNFTSDDPLQRISENIAGTSDGYRDGIWSSAKFTNLKSIILDNNSDWILTDGNLIRKIYNSSGTNYVATVDGKSAAGNVDSTLTPITWDPYGIEVDSEDNVYFSEITNDTIGAIKSDPTGGSNKVELYRRMQAGAMGIGEGSNKATCGFIKVEAVDPVDGKIPKFKKIQFVGDDPAAMLFAALDTEDSLWLWGSSVDGAFGTGQINNIGPTKIYAFDKNILDFQITCSTTGRSLISIITKENGLFSAGDNNDLQLGRGETVLTNVLYTIFKQCKKDSSTLVDDAKQIIEARETGYKNNLYIATNGDVYACGDGALGVLGRSGATVDSAYFQKVDTLTDIIYLIGASNGAFANHTIFAIKNDGTLWSWGYNGAALGQSLTNEITLAILQTPSQCYNFETKDVVRNAKYIYVNDGLPEAGRSMVAYLDDKGDLYVGGWSTDSDIPDFAANTPYFRKFNMKNIATDVNLVGEQAIIHRSNGTVYTINRYGAKKAF